MKTPAGEYRDATKDARAREGENRRYGARAILAGWAPRILPKSSWKRAVRDPSAACAFRPHLARLDASSRPDILALTCNVVRAAVDRRPHHGSRAFMPMC